MCVTIPLSDLSAQQKIPIAVVSLRDGGFFPQKITCSSGKLLLVVKNKSQADNIILGMARTDGLTAIPAAATPQLSQDYVLTLGSGTYTLTDSAHPKWTPLTLIVQ
jgi:hypothetical protein